MLNLAFAGFRHSHVYSLYLMAAENKGINIAGAWEGFKQAEQEAQQKHNVLFTHSSYKDLLSDSNIDAIAIGNYYGARGKMAIDALKAGKHIIADKPLCTSLDELNEIKRLSARNNLKIGLMLDLRYHKNILSVKKVIEKGTLGSINNIYFGGQHPLSYGVRPAWYFEKCKHGGVINDIAIHGVDLITYLTGLGIKTIISARCWNAFAKEEPHFKDSAQMMLELENSAGVIADVSYSAPNSFGLSLPHSWRFEIWGTKAMAVFSVNSDGIELYRDGSNAVERLEGVNTEKNSLTDFLGDIKGDSNIFLNTSEVIRSSEAALNIQHWADTENNDNI